MSFDLDPRSARTVAGLLAVAWVASVAWPLATYTLTLALFGVAHVLAELRYVDLRFSAALGKALRVSLLVALAAIASLRLGLAADVVQPGTAVTLELGIGLGLIALVLPTIARRGRVAAIATSVALAAALGVTIVASPAMALLTFAVVHNFTPAAFLLEGTAGAQRRRRALALAVVFVALPGLIIVGVPWMLLDAAGLTAPELSPLGYGPLVDAMRSYLPAAWHGHSLALPAFSACVFLQCVHYIAVLLVMPRRVSTARGWIRWPSRRTWVAVLVGSTVLVAAYAVDFPRARQGYGALAAVHAWLELPILLLAVAGLRATAR